MTKTLQEFQEQMHKSNAIKFGFLTVATDFLQEAKPGVALIEQNMQIARDNGYNCIDLGMFPLSFSRDFAGKSLDETWVLENPQRARDEIGALAETYGVGISALTFCGNTLGDEKVRRHLNVLIDVARELHIPNIVAFVGNAYQEMAKNGIKEVREKELYHISSVHSLIGPLAEKACNLGITMSFENCPMPMSFDRSKGLSIPTSIDNVNESPYSWRLNEKALGDLFKLCFDASHIRNYRPSTDADPQAKRTIAQCIKDFRKQIVYVHQKDGEDVDGLEAFTNLGSPLTNNSHARNLWKARIPGNSVVGQGIDYLHQESLLNAYCPNVKYRVLEIEEDGVVGNGLNPTVAGIKRVSQHLTPIFRAVYR